MKRLDHLLELAIRSHNGTSFSPEKRGAQMIAGHNEQLNADIEEIMAAAKKYEQDGSATADRYASKYEKYLTAYLHSRSNIVSSMIAGPSNFPVARMNKRSQWADNKLSELFEFRDRVLKKIKKGFAPKITPLTELEEAKKNLAEREQTQEFMKKINGLHAKYLKGDERAVEDADIDQKWKTKIKTYIPEYSWVKHPFAPYQLSNNNQNIIRLKKRVNELEAKAVKFESSDTKERTIKGIKIVENSVDDRLQLFFPGKPEQPTIQKLKSGGWRWSPFNKCWQRKLTVNAKYCAEHLLEQL